MPSEIAQDPALEPAWVTEGTLPLWMCFGSFHVAGQAWAKYHYEHPWGSFAEWLERLEQKYDRDNAKAKLFWAEFSRDPERQAKILADRSLRRETRRIVLICPRGACLSLNPNPWTKPLMLDASHIVCKGTLCPNETHGGLRSF